MTKFLTTRRVLVLTGILLMVAIFSFPGKTTGIPADNCLVSEENEEETELFWESLSRQFSGSVSY
jgi:hypothetical protein